MDMMLRVCGLFLVAIALSTPFVDASLKKLIRAPRNAKVEHIYFVEVSSDASVDRIAAEVEKENKDAIILGKIHLAGHGFSAYLPNQSTLEKVLAKDEVDFIEEDHKVSSGATRHASQWGLDRLDTNSIQLDHQYTPPCNLTGAGVDVFVLDSGIWYPHQSFGGRAVYAGCDPVDQLSKTNRSGLDCTGHGSHVAGIVGGSRYGVAPGATIFSVRVLDCSDSGSFNAIVLGVECVLKTVKKRRRPAVVNLSIYGSKNFAVKRAMDKLMREGIPVVAIAGNHVGRPRDACKVAPASVHGMITVSASTRTDSAYFQSNAGICVDLYAPGVDITSTGVYCSSCHDTKTGSSMAAPHVTGAVALLLEKCPNITPWKVRYILLSQMVAPQKLDFTAIPNSMKRVTPNLLLHTSTLQCDAEC